ncbi:hypothetical protein SAMN05421810_102207 [Amycolatopsis arida]|uniref:Ig-like domain-containing protein n=1 Tax=Amycolatopsis arida TaxID=587909 RepID=A0A1I5P9R6_9PSEU|nr:hypothetical protein [Amycolatopsis arida]TDX98415.1 hypothetical protein CLV69_101207 [Amycolatopsis arida]SFP30785.1 hypothetical protein SAMN05421810_102207 [Amycolatopsis arida]
MSSERRDVWTKLRIAAVGLLAALSSLVVTGNAQADTGAQQVDVPPVCSGGTDKYTFHQPGDSTNPGLDLVPKPTKFSGSSQTYSTCTAAANGATKFFLKSLSGEGNLACTVNANTTGTAEIHWLRDESGTVAAKSHGEVINLVIDGASKEVSVRIRVESGAYAGHILVLSYTSTADTRECVSPDGMKTVFGLLKAVTVV